MIKDSQEKLELVCSKFNIPGELIHIKHFTLGHINSTDKVTFLDNNNINAYIVQKVNKHVFPDIIKLMDNIVYVTTYIREKIIESGQDPSKYVLNFLKTTEGLSYYFDGENYYRCYICIPDSTTYNIGTYDILYQSGCAFGEFQMYLDGIDVEKLYPIIPDFHNTKNRYELFKKAIKENKFNRVIECQELISQYLELENVATILYTMHENRELPLRATHNDTKCNNVLFDKETNKHLAVIDLDTVMSGLVAYDFGDSIRFSCSSTLEDETNLDKVYIDLDKYETFSKGFLEIVKNKLTKKEIETLPLGAVTMTIECGVRFLTDYLEGDHYFHTDYRTQNLLRAKNQLKLAKDMLDNYKEMEKIIFDICK